MIVLTCRVSPLAPIVMSLYCLITFALSAGRIGVKPWLRPKRVSLNVAVDTMGGDKSPEVVIHSAARCNGECLCQFLSGDGEPKNRSVGD